MHYLYLRRTESEEGAQYTYWFDDHDLSPANQILTRLFRQMILAVEESLDGLEVEYLDAKMARDLGVARAQELLRLLGANKSNISENKKGDVVLSRIFRAPLTPEALHYFKFMKDLEELAAYRLLSGERSKAEVFFVKWMSVALNSSEEKKFLELLREERIPYKII